MIANPTHLYLSPEEYLQWEAKQPIKHEYINGKSYAMTDKTLNHTSIDLNIASVLKSHVRGKGCKAYMADAKLGISEQGNFFYPDVIVTCDERDKKETSIIYHPCLIIEVLSPSTEAFDRGDKFKDYRQIDTLKEYVLIDAQKLNVELFRLNEQGIWELHLCEDDEKITLQSINFSCYMSLIYEDINFTENIV